MREKAICWLDFISGTNTRIDKIIKIKHKLFKLIDFFRILTVVFNLNLTFVFDEHFKLKSIIINNQ